MKIRDFKTQLTESLKTICHEKKWSFDNSKLRGMAFEDWCFNLFSERYPTADNDPQECIIRGDDAGIDIFFESKETDEIYILQCKHPKIAATDPIPEDDVKSFFSNYVLLKDRAYLKNRNTNNPKIQELASEFDYWISEGFLIHFIFISSGKSTDKTTALAEKYNRDHQNQNVKFDVWDITALRDEFVSIKSIEEQYPNEVVFNLAKAHYMLPDGEHENITFAVRGTSLQQIARDNKDSLFNWNIRRFLGKKGEVNSGLMQTIEKEPNNFFYYNNGISALCEEFTFDEKTKRLKAKKLQIVNGAQTIGALRNADPEKVSDVLVLVKLTSIKHASKERGIAAALIKTNNTQNTLRVPDFRSNDRIQQWLETQFKNTKPRGEMKQIVYGRKRPYPRSSSSQVVLKLQDLGKIRYAWLYDPRTPIADPARLFQLREENGLYEYAFGSDGESVDVWTDDQFRDCLLAIHAYNKIQSELAKMQSEFEDLKQVTRLKYYGLRLFRKYFELEKPSAHGFVSDEIFAFGSRFNDYFERANKLICKTLAQAYREILKREEGTAFSLPRDSKVWEMVETKFDQNLEFVREFAN